MVGSSIKGEFRTSVEDFGVLFGIQVSQYKVLRVMWGREFWEGFRMQGLRIRVVWV